MEFIDSVLIVGGGGREHALHKALLRTYRPFDKAICTFAYPGNPGMERDGCMLVDRDISGWGDLALWAVRNEIDLVVIGPEVPLVEGATEAFKKSGIPVFGPSKAAARIEGSKAFAKDLMKKYKIPTAAFETFTNKASALAYAEKQGAPLVVKVSGLAAGKGAIVCDTMDEVKVALADIFDKKLFGEAGGTVVIEEKMEGEEASVFVITDGKSYKILPPAQDHKTIGDGDTGPNTGGMGAYAPASGVVNEAMMKRIEKEIIVPTLDAMAKEKSKFTGVLFIGLMMTKDGPKVIEYNCRFGDPETQAILPLINCDWFEVFKACAEGELSSVKWSVSAGYCAAVVMASKGYPGKFTKGKVIKGLDKAESMKSVDVYMAGVSVDKNDRFLTDGGRVLAVSARGKTLYEAITLAYEGVSEIKFDGATFRKDIGAKGLPGYRKTTSAPVVKEAPAPVKKAAVKKAAPVKKETTKKTPVKKAPAKKAAPTKKAVVKKAAVKKTSAKKSVKKK